MGNARLGIKNYIFGIDSLSLHEGRSVFVVVLTQPITSNPPYGLQQETPKSNV